MAEKCGDLTSVEVESLLDIPHLIIEARAGFKLLTADFEDAAGGALAEHAFGELSEALIEKNPAWKEVIEVIVQNNPLPPMRGR